MGRLAARHVSSSNAGAFDNWEEMKGEKKEDRTFMEMVNDDFLQ